MRQVTITLGGKSYKLQCRPGDETQVRDLGLLLDERVSRLSSETGSPVNERLLVMAALLILDELCDLQASHPLLDPEQPPSTKPRQRRAS